MSESDAALIGIEPCGCITYANARPDAGFDRYDRDAHRKLLERGGQLIRTTVGEARAMPNFLPSECPHVAVGR